MNLSRHEEKKWETLRNFTLKIFKESPDLEEGAVEEKKEEAKKENQ